MIEWKLADSFAYYFDPGHTKIGEMWIDKSRQPKIWRLRFNLRGEKECTVVRIDKRPGSNLYRLMCAMTSQDLYGFGADMVVVAQKLGFTIKGPPRTLPVSGIFRTSLVPHD